MEAPGGGGVPVNQQQGPPARVTSIRWDQDGPAQPSPAVQGTPPRGRAVHPRWDKGPNAAGRQQSPSVKRDSSGNPRAELPSCNNNGAGQATYEAWTPSKRPSKSCDGGRFPLGVNTEAAGRLTAAAAGTPLHNRSRSYGGPGPRTSPLPVDSVTASLWAGCRKMAVKAQHAELTAAQDRQTEAAGHIGAAILAKLCATHISTTGSPLSAHRQALVPPPVAAAAAPPPTRDDANLQDHKQLDKMLAHLPSLESSFSPPASSSATSSGGPPFKGFDAHGTTGTTSIQQRSHQQQQDAQAQRAGWGSFSLSGRQSEPARALQGELVALEPEVLRNLQQSSQRNHNLLQNYKERGLQASDFVAAAKDQAVEALLLCPGANPELLTITLHGKQAGSGAFGSTAQCSICSSSSGSAWVGQQHTQHLLARRQEQQLEAGDSSMRFALKLLHEPEFLPAQLPYSMCFTPAMRSASQEVLAMQRCQGNHTCKALGMVLIAVPAAAGTAADGAAAAAAAHDLAARGFKLVHPFDRPLTAEAPKTNSTPPTMLVYTGTLMHLYPGSLADLVAARAALGERLPRVEAGLLLAGILRGINAGHEAGIIHHDIKAQNVLLGLSPHASGQERDLLLERGVGSLDAWVLSPAVSDFGGASLGGLARPQDIGYGTSTHRDPQLLSTSGRAVCDKALADVHSAGATYLELRGCRKFLHLKGQALLDEVTRKANLETDELQMLGLMLCDHSARKSCAALLQESLLLKIADGKLQKLDKVSRDLEVMELKLEVQREREAGKLALLPDDQPAMQLPPWGEQRTPSGVAGAAGAAQGDQQLGGQHRQQPPNIRYSRQDVVLGARSSSSMGFSGLEAVVGGAPGAQQHAPPQPRPLAWAEDRRPAGVSGFSQGQRQQMAAPHLQQQPDLAQQQQQQHLAPPPQLQSLAWAEDRRPAEYGIAPLSAPE